MAVSTKLQEIKTYFVGALQAINGTGGYTNTVATINQRTVNKIADVSAGAAEISVELKSKAPSGVQVFKKRGRFALVEITGQVMNAGDADTNDTVLFTLDADIEKAIGASLTCGGIASGVTPISTTFLYGDNGVQCVVTVQVFYFDEVAP